MGAVDGCHGPASRVRSTCGDGTKGKPFSELTGLLTGEGLFTSFMFLQTSHSLRKIKDDIQLFEAKQAALCIAFVEATIMEVITVDDIPWTASNNPEAFEHMVRTRVSRSSTASTTVAQAVCCVLCAVARYKH